MRVRTVRSFAVLASVALLVGAFAAGPAEAKKKKKKKAPACATYAPAAPASPAAAAADAPKQTVVQVTPAATEAAPVKVELDQGPGLWAYGPDLNQLPVVDDTQFVNLQVSGAPAGAGLYIRQEWSASSPDDLDMYVYDASGTEVTNSGAFNAAPVPPVSSTSGGLGYEQVSGFAVPNCMGVTVESRTYLTEGQAVTISAWLGEAVAPTE